MKKNRAVFLDLNGTVVLPIKPKSLDEITLIPGADKAIQQLLDVGFICPVVTVQAGIDQGYFRESKLRAWFADFFSNLNLDVKGPYICPHRENRRCQCEKPNSFLYEQAAAELLIDLHKSYTIGDRLLDVQAAQRFGGTGCLVRTGYAKQDGFSEEAETTAAFIGDTITDAVDWILAKRRLGKHTDRQ